MNNYHLYSNIQYNNHQRIAAPQQGGNLVHFILLYIIKLITNDPHSRKHK